MQRHARPLAPSQASHGAFQPHSRGPSPPRASGEQPQHSLALPQDPPDVLHDLLVGPGLHVHQDLLPGVWKERPGTEAQLMRTAPEAASPSAAGAGTLVTRTHVFTEPVRPPGALRAPGIGAAFRWAPSTAPSSQDSARRAAGAAAQLAREWVGPARARTNTHEDGTGGSTHRAPSPNSPFSTSIEPRGAHPAFW